MQNRSWLLVPGDSDRKLGKAMATGADIVVVDLADSVPVAAKNDARRMAADWLNAHRRQILESRRLGRWVRINPFESRQWREDLMAVVRAAPDGIVLSNATGTEAVRQLAAELYELEQANQIPSGSIKIMPVLGSSAHSACSILSFADVALPRLAGITWDADKLALAIGATRQRDTRLGWAAALGLVRAQVLLAAHANGVLAVETCCTDGEDSKALKAAVQDARADGFTGMFAIHPAQVAEVNAAFTPTPEEIEYARRIVAVFEANGESGELQIDRRTIGQSQLQQARRMLHLESAQAQSPARMPILRTA
jgi:citrate lyase subunit beta/citryl-CoA lyase